jgi:hypothetical protein
MRAIALLMLMLAALVATPACHRPAAEDSPEAVRALHDSGPAGATLARWLAAINAASRARIQAIHAGEKDAEVNTDRDVAMAERSGGFRLHHLERASATEVAVVVQGKQTRMWTEVSLAVAPEPPHAIASILLRPAEPPAGAIERPVAVLDARTRGEVVEALGRELQRAYVYPDRATAMAQRVRARLAEHAYDRLTEPAELAATLTEDLRAVTHDKHLRLDTLAGGPRGPGGPGGPRRMFPQSRRLPGNIAFLEIGTFGVPPHQARDEVSGAMTAIADASALILDVRRNGGGDPETVALMASYLFGEQPVHLNSMYWRIPGRTDQFFTDPGVPGTRFGATKPLYVLTSAQTFSGAEEFAYDLQALKRATIVGETTGGGAHPTGPVALPHGLVVLVPTGRAINPITKTNWEGTGVKPDVAVPADAALARAQELAAGACLTSRAP